MTTTIHAVADDQGQLIALQLTPSQQGHIRHGSWLDMAECELSVLARQCLDRRIPDKQTLTDEIAAWVAGRNKHDSKEGWRFTTAGARIKLKRLCPHHK